MDDRNHYFIMVLGESYETFTEMEEIGRGVTAMFYQSQRGGPRGVSPWVKALPAGSGGLLAT